jgi:hypothetical protein
MRAEGQTVLFVACGLGDLGGSFAARNAGYDLRGQPDQKKSKSGDGARRELVIQL